MAPVNLRLVAPALLYVADETGEHQMSAVAHDLLHRGREEIVR